MRAHLFPADDSACRTYRLLHPAAAVEAAGATVAIEEPVWPKHKGYDEVPEHFEPGDAEVLVAHRPTFTAMADELYRLRAEGRALVIDVDDDLDLMPRLPARYLDAQSAVLREVCERADLVTCTSAALAAKYGAHGRTRIVRNGIPAALLEQPRASDGRTLGWAGLASGHVGDLPVTVPAVPEVLASEGWRFKLIGPAEDVRVQLALTEPVDATGSVTLERYQAELGTLDVGIVPLAANHFNECKSALKGLEYASRGVPFVASPAAEYMRLHDEGVGLLANTPREWYSGLRDLMRDESLRLEHAQRGREIVAEKHTYETRAGEWLDAWEQAIENRRSRP